MIHIKPVVAVIMALLTLNVSGCASMNQAYSAYGASALVDARGASDNALKTAVVAVCMTPYDTIVRNPTVVPGLMALCLPGGNFANPASPLEAIDQSQKK